jgi:hypothetical protein
MSKPGKSQKWLITGLVLQGIGGFLYVSGIVSSFRSAMLGDSGGSSGVMIVGGILAFVGWLVLLGGVSRVSAGIDYLVSVAPSPVSGVERREQESRLAASPE